MGIVGWLRWGWRQLTSMRVALILLFLLALASIPGSLFPQRGINPTKVQQYLALHPGSGPILDRLGIFDVYASPWFASVYLLLFVSLIGCVLPRLRAHWKALRALPPVAPSRLEKLPAHQSVLVAATPAQVLEQAAEDLGKRGFRVRREADFVSAEKGYLHETGNLIFHAALVVILIGVATGSLYGYRGNVLVREGQGFSNTLTQYDSFKPGRLFVPEKLTPFSFNLRNFSVSFETQGKQRGAPREFYADVDYQATPASPAQPFRIEVNKPLTINGSKVFLVGWGYAPRVTVRDGKGNVVLKDSVAFLPQDGNFTSSGVIKSPDAKPKELGIQAIFLPTTSIDPQRGPISQFPAAVTPGLFMSAWVGDLGLNTGAPQSIYKLDTSKMKKLGIEALAPGQTWKIPRGAGTVTFDGVSQFATFSIAHDPGTPVALIAAIVSIAGLVMSLFTRRRRIWVRTTSDDQGRTVVAVAGLARTENTDIESDVEAVITSVVNREEKGHA